MNPTANLFIGREAELALVGDLIAAPSGSRRVLFIKGEGGVGKSWLMQKISDQCDEFHRTLGVPLACTRVADMDDFSLRLMPNLEKRWVADLGAEWFENYLQSSKDYARIASVATDAEWLQEVDQRRITRFVDDFANFAKNHRVLFLMDTIERLKNSPLWQTFTKMIEQLDNTVWIFAGREFDTTQTEFERKFGKAIVSERNLLPFTTAESASYFGGTEIGPSIDSEMREKLSILTGGRPVLLTLAVEWLRRDMPIDGITERPLAELEQMSAAELEKTKQAFERILVNKILELSALDQTFLLMAYANRRLDAEILAFLQNIPLAESARLIKQASEFGFVKPRAQDVYILHDEMQSLVMKHAWTRVDPHGSLRRQYGHRLVAYYEQRLAELAKTLTQLMTLYKANPTEDLHHRIADVEQENEIAELERFYYILQIDAANAKQYFVKSFEQATKAYHYDFRALLWQQMEPNIKRYDGTDHYEISMCGVKYLLDSSRFEQGYALAQELYQRYARRNVLWRLELLLQLGNIAVRLGKMHEALEHFEAGLKVCQPIPADRRRKRVAHLDRHTRDEWQGRFHSARGWTLRLTGKWKEAVKAYNQALQYSRRVGDKERIAQLYNNLGYVCSLLGDRQAGLDLSKQALSLWETMRRDRWIATTHSTIGSILTMMENYEPALKYYNQALRIFREQEDWEWIETVYYEMAYSKWLRAVNDERQLNEALQDIEEALAICKRHNIQKELPSVLHRLAHIHLSLGNVAQAQIAFDESLKLAKQIQDNYRIVDNFVAQAEMAYRNNPADYATISACTKQVEVCLDAEDLDYPLLQGRIYRVLGDSLFAAGKTDQALQYYGRAFPLIARHGGYGDYRLSRELEDLASKVHQLPSPKASAWIKELRKSWGKNIKKDNTRREVLFAFCDAQFAPAETSRRLAA